MLNRRHTPGSPGSPLVAGPRCFTVVSEAKVAGCGAPLLGEALRDSTGVDVVLLSGGPCLGEERYGVGDDVV